MKFLLKIFLAPIIAVLAVFTWFCFGILYISSWIFGIAGTVLGLLGLAILIFDNLINGIAILILAVIVSPLGLPMFAAWLLGQLQKLRYFIQDRVYG